MDRTENFTTQTRNAPRRQMDCRCAISQRSKTWQRFCHHMSDPMACTGRDIKESLIQTLVAGTA